MEQTISVQHTTSADGTEIAYERQGHGPAVVLVGGAFNDRHSSAELATALSPHFTAVSYDRRGRGDSGDTPPYTVQRELEDLEAVIGAVGTTAFAHGMSSGGALLLRAAAAGVPLTRISVMEPPFRVAGAPPAPPRYLETLIELTSTGRNDEAVAYFMTDAVGLPPEAVAQTRQMPMWAGLVTMAPTLVYDAHVMGDSQLAIDVLAAVTAPTLVLHSTSSAPWLQSAAAATAEALPGARLRGLEGGFHSVPPDVLAAALTEFFIDAD